MKSDKDFDPIETREWIESLDDVIDDQGTDRASFLLNELAKHLSLIHISSPRDY